MLFLYQQQHMLMGLLLYGQVIRFLLQIFYQPLHTQKLVEFLIQKKIYKFYISLLMAFNPIAFTESVIQSTNFVDTLFNPDHFRIRINFLDEILFDSDDAIEIQKSRMVNYNVFIVENSTYVIKNPDDYV